MEHAKELALEHLGLQNKGYKALFLQGGASMEFLMVAYNFLENKAGYTLTPELGQTRQLKKLRLFGDVVEVASSKAANFNYIPKDYRVPTGLDFFHCTSNNTIFGTQMNEFPQDRLSH